MIQREFYLQKITAVFKHNPIDVFIEKLEL